ncbi:MAG: M23 family metallopeptidase [Acidobacteriota bacterium]|nr:MAG: M23 family metallopeptidase [Acidobacteriota bacterium]
MNRANRVRFRFGCGFFLLLILLTPTVRSATLEIGQKARSIQPGEVLLLTVESDEALTGVSASGFDRTFPFFPVTEHKWEGLVGIDLDVRPGSYDIAVDAKSLSGVLEKVHRIKVLPKKFPVRELKVEPKYVEPPASEMKRIQEESRLIKQIFSGVRPERLWEGPFLRPVPGEANSSFGKRSVYNGKPRSPHTGTDFRGAEGTPVKAPGAGEVLLVRNLYFAGNTVIIDHGQGLFSYFAHLSKFDVKEGDRVARGDVVGRVGATGRVTGPHLHWTLRLVETRVSPLSLLEVTQ